jgi:hypothetical protein
MEVASAEMWLRNRVAIAHVGAANLEQFTPLLYDPPPQWLADAVERARVHGRSENPEAARAVIADTLSPSSGQQRAAFGRYREHVTWTHAQNVRRLAALAWVWVRLCQEPRNVELDRTLERVERFAAMHFSVTELRNERGWAERAVKQSMLPPAWLDA